MFLNPLAVGVLSLVHAVAKKCGVGNLRERKKLAADLDKGSRRGRKYLANAGDEHLGKINEERSLQPRLRTNGTGLPGYQAGWFKLRNGENALIFVTDRQRVFYIPTREGYSLLLSVTTPKAFLNALQRAAKG